MTEGHKHPPYLAIFGALAALTAVELAAAIALASHKALLIMILVTLALVKAGLVAAYFMHLKFERKTFIVIVCFPLLLAVVLITALFPDVGWMHGGSRHTAATHEGGATGGAPPAEGGAPTAPAETK